MTEFQSITTSHSTALGGFFALASGCLLRSLPGDCAAAGCGCAVAFWMLLRPLRNWLADLSDSFSIDVSFFQFLYFCMDSLLTSTNNNLCCVNFWAVRMS